MKSSIWKKAAYWLFGSVFALVAIASVAVSFLDWNQYRATLSSLASDQLGMRVDLAGRVSVGLFPRPAVSAETVRLFPAADSADVVATADRIDMRLGLSALLKGKLSIQHLGFDGLDLVLEEYGEGAWRVRGWPEPETSEAPRQESASNIQMERLQLIGGAIHLNEMSGVTRSIEGLTLDLKGNLPQGPLEWDGGFNVAGEQITTSGRLRPSRSGDAVSLKTDLAVRGGKVMISGRLEDGGFAGRVQSAGEDLSAFSSAVQSISNNQPASVAVPAAPFELDLQIDRDGSLYRVVSRMLSVGETRGRVDLTVAGRGEGAHLAGSVAIGVVDLQPWLDTMQAQPEQEALAEEPEGGAIPLSGAIDVAVEAVRYGEGTVQQLDAVVSLTPTGLVLDDFQALLPGGSGLSINGRLSGKDGQAQIQLVSGNLPELLRWIGVDVSGKIPTGRLATGEVAATLALMEGAWQLDGLKGRVDTTNFSGRVIGGVGAWPRDIDLKVDTVNFNAYFSDGEAGGEPADIFGGLPEMPVDVKLTLQAALWGSEQYRDVAVEASLGRQAIEITKFSASQAPGALQLTATVRPRNTELELELDGQFSRWPVSSLNAVMPTAQGYILALGAKRADGKISASGPLSSLHLSADLREGNKRAASASGNVGIQDQSLRSVKLQGTLQHENLQPLLAHIGAPLAGDIPTNLTFSAEKGAGGALAVRVSGATAGGQLLAEGSLQDAGAQAWQVTYDHRSGGEVVRLLGGGITLPDPREALRASATIKLEGDTWKAENLDIRNGGARITGALDGSGTDNVTGNLTVAGLQFAPTASSASSAGPSGDTAIERDFLAFAGDVALKLDQLVIAGQKISAGNARLLAGDGIVRLSLGDGAVVNGSPSVLSLDIRDGDVPAVSGRINLPNLDIAAMLGASGLKSAVTGTAALDFQFVGQGVTWEAMMRSLKGQGSVQGQAGSLNFLNVPTLVREMGRAPSTSSFLGSVGGWLRQGQTQYAVLEASFTLDAGTALVEKLTASGEWGALTLDGQVNFIDEFLSMKGVLDLLQPEDAPSIPVEYNGPLNNPTSNWASRALERFVIAGIERRLRASLMRDLGKEGSNPSNPGAEVFSRAFGLLGALRDRQEAAKKAAEEAANETGSQGTEGQTP